jgi:hypothetical protein
VITDPPHTSHIFQALDVLLFGVLQRAKNIKEEMIHLQSMLTMSCDFSGLMKSQRQA